LLLKSGELFTYLEEDIQHAVRLNGMPVRLVRIFNQIPPFQRCLRCDGIAFGSWVVKNLNGRIDRPEYLPGAGAPARLLLCHHPGNDPQPALVAPLPTWHPVVLRRLTQPPRWSSGL
jgi:hypothetical protein